MLLTFGISSVLLIASILDVPKAYWMGIATMSVTLPFRSDLEKRVKYRRLGTIGGSILFVLVYLLLPESCHTYMGILGGIGMGLSVHYGWQTAFNAFSALSIAVSALGLQNAIFFRIFNNIFSSAYMWIVDRIFQPFISFISNHFNKGLLQNR